MSRRYSAQRFLPSRILRDIKCPHRALRC
ncbi:protein of unknown function [Burkholderia multivorans]